MEGFSLSTDVVQSSLRSVAELPVRDEVPGSGHWRDKKNPGGPGHRGFSYVVNTELFFGGPEDLRDGVDLAQ
jgi:hypothetical protein